MVQVFSQQRRMARGQIGCTAHLRKLQREDNGIWPSTLKVIAEGRSHPYTLKPLERHVLQGLLLVSVVNLSACHSA